MMQFERPIAIAYFRVSTARQGVSGLGLEAQRAAVSAFCEARGLTLDSVHTEVESGRRSDRPELAKAFARARRIRGVVVIAKLDRLARDVHFISGLVRTGQAFACVDAPDDDAFMLHIRASVAEDEARKISHRTREALAAAKARGVKLGVAGKNNLTREGTLRGAQAAAAAHRAAKASAYADLVPTMRALSDRGLSLRAIAAELNAEGHTTRSGKPWNPVQVSRVLGTA